MHFVRIKYDRGSYSYAGGSDLKMDILGSFLTSDVRCTGSSFKDWALEDSEIGTSSNITELEKKNGYIYLSDLYSEEEVPTKLKMTKAQFIKILDDWETKVCKARPEEVIIRYENNEFSIEIPH